ncbi:MAG: GAF domain-containing protein [Gemmatimonadaceae bacterium]
MTVRTSGRRRGSPSSLTLANDPPRSEDGGNREQVSGASARLRALAVLSGSLTDAPGPDEAAVLVEKEALSALGATSAIVVTLGAFPPPTRPASGPDTPPPNATLHVVHAIGVPAEAKTALEELPLDAPGPFQDVARRGEPLFMESAEALEESGDWGKAMLAAGAGAAAVVPVWANGELRGVLGLSWTERRTFDKDERAFVLTLGVMCAQAIMRAYLKAAERRAREGAEQANRSKATFLATMSHKLRPPLEAMMGYTDRLASGVSGQTNAAQQNTLGRMHTAGAHVLELVDELLAHADIGAGEDAANV